MIVGTWMLVFLALAPGVVGVVACWHLLGPDGEPLDAVTVAASVGVYAVLAALVAI